MVFILVNKYELEANGLADVGWGGVEVGALIFARLARQLHRVRVCCWRRSH